MDIKEHGSPGATSTVTNGDCHSSRTVKSGISQVGQASTSEAWMRLGLQHHSVGSSNDQWKEKSCNSLPISPEWSCVQTEQWVMGVHLAGMAQFAEEDVPLLECVSSYTETRAKSMLRWGMTSQDTRRKCPWGTYGSSSVTARCKLTNTNYRIYVGAKKHMKSVWDGGEDTVGIRSSNSIIQLFSHSPHSKVGSDSGY